MKLSDQDIEILKWINSFGFVEIIHISKKFSISENKLLKQLNNLINNDYLLFEKILHDEPGIYRVTSKGVKETNDHLKPIKKVSLATYQHHLQLVPLSLNLTKKYNASFVTERTIRNIKGLKGVGQKGHISDGELHISQKKIAIEFELSSKSLRRRREIIRHYLKAIEYDEMWYIYKKKSIYNEIAPLITKMPFIKLLFFDEIITTKPL